MNGLRRRPCWVVPSRSGERPREALRTAGQTGSHSLAALRDTLPLMSVRDTREEFRRHVDDAVMVLFTLVTEGIGWATVALLDQDQDRAQAIIDGDRGI